MNCPNGEDYSPCRCIFPHRNSPIQLDCPFKFSPEQVNDAFESTTETDIDFICLRADLESTPDFNIPKNIFVNHRITKAMELYGNFNYDPTQNVPEIDAEAFVSSWNFTKKFVIRYSNVGLMKSFDFLAGFNQLKEIQFLQSVNFSLPYLPPLPNLVSLVLYQTTGINEWTHFPNLTKGLETIDLTAIELNDEMADRVLAWILTSPSKYSLKILYFHRENLLTQIPHKIKYFPNLYYISFQLVSSPQQCG